MSAKLANVIKRNLSSKNNAIDKCWYAGAGNKPQWILSNHHIETSIWSEISINDSDIFLVSPAKSGSTWMYEVIARLLYQNVNLKDVGYNSLIELCLSPTFNSFQMGGPTIKGKEMALSNIENQLLNDNIKHRVFKGHEPVESMPFNSNNKYIFVARDYRDIIWSFYNHYRNYAQSIVNQINAERYYGALPSKFTSFDEMNKNKDFTEYEFWKMSVSTGDDFGNPDGFPFWSQLWVIGSWLNIASKYDNIKVIHYNEMKQDLPKVIRSIADFLQVEIDENAFNDLVANCQFDVMKQRQNELFGEIGKMWWKEPSNFFNKGINNRWKDTLTDEDIQQYRSLAARYLSPSNIDWLEKGYKFQE